MRIFLLGLVISFWIAYLVATRTGPPPTADVLYGRVVCRIYEYIKQVAHDLTSGRQLHAHTVAGGHVEVGDTRNGATIYVDEGDSIIIDGNTFYSTSVSGFTTSINGMRVVVVGKKCPDDSVRETDEYERLRRQAELCKGKLHGTERVWNQDGVLTRETNWHHGQRHGVEKVWADNGEPLRETDWNFDERHGTETLWNPYDFARSVSEYNFGVLHGLQRTWYSGGALASERTMNFGELHGREWYGDPTGAITHETHWNFGERHGVETYCNGQHDCKTTHWRFGEPK